MQGAPQPTNLEVSTRLAGRVLLTLVVGLGLMHFAISGFDLPFSRLFHLDAEAGLGTWFASILAFGAAALAAATAIRTRSVGSGGWLWWALFGMALLAVSVDEIVQIHETIGRRVGAELRTDGPEGAGMAGTPLLGLAIAPAVVVGCMALWRIARPEARTLLVTGLIVFWVGAIGFEELEFRNFDRSLGLTSGVSMETGDFVLVGIQEILEMAGMALIFFGLTRHITSVAEPVEIRFVSDSDQPDR